MSKPLNLTGQVFYKLTVIDKAGKDKRGNIRWNCICSCGKKTIVLANNLRCGNSKSCGCFIKEISTTHGMTKTPEHRSWKSMKGRCLNKKNPSYDWYGAKGITICNSWLMFENFFSDMGHRPENTSLDRIDSYGNYEPNNCRWTTKTQQARNRIPQKKSISGLNGVSKHKNSWYSRITVNKKQIYLYGGKDFEKACRLRLEAEARYWQS